MSRLIVGLVLFSAIILSSNAAHLEGEGEMHASQRSKPGVDIVHAKLFFRVPFFNENSTYTEVRCQLDKKVALKFRDASLRYIYLLLVNDLRSLSTDDYKSIMHSFSFWQDEYRRLKLTDESLVQESFIQMLMDLLDHAAEVPSSHAIDGDAAYSRFETTIGGIYNLIEASPKGAYLRWDEATVNGQSLKSYLEPFIATIYARRAYFVDTISMMFRRILSGEF